jgi:hypothetical protein
VCGKGGNVWKCAWLCAAVHVAVRAAVCGSVWHCVAVLPAMRGSALYVYIYTKSLTMCSLLCPYIRGGGTEPHIPGILILTDQYYELLI